MSDTQSVYFVVMRYDKELADEGVCVTEVPVKIFATRARARQYADVMSNESKRWEYFVHDKGVKLG